MNNPTISVIMCSFNTNELFLKQAVESILKQTLSNFELIIIDDGSTNFPSFDLFEDTRVKEI